MSDITKVEYTKCENFLKEMRNNSIGQCKVSLAPLENFKKFSWLDIDFSSYPSITPDLTKTFGVNTASIDYFYNVAFDIVYNYPEYFNKAKLKIIINKFKEANKKILRIYSKLSLYDIERTLYRVKYNRSKKLIDKLIRLVKKM